MLYYNQKKEFEFFANPDSCKPWFRMTDNIPEILCSETYKMLQLKGQ